MLTLSLSLFTFCLSVEHAGSLERGQLSPGWNQALRQTSNVPTSLAQSYGDSGRASPAQLFACLSRQLVITNHFQFFQGTPPVTVRWYTVRPTIGAWREGNKDHDIDATTSSGSLPWSSRCHCLPIYLFPLWTDHHRPRSCLNAQEK